VSEVGAWKLGESANAPKCGTAQGPSPPPQVTKAGRGPSRLDGLLSVLGLRGLVGIKRKDWTAVRLPKMQTPCQYLPIGLHFWQLRAAGTFLAVGLHANAFVQFFVFNFTDLFFLFNLFFPDCYGT
jgi:hypothetical protein